MANEWNELGHERTTLTQPEKALPGAGIHDAQFAQAAVHVLQRIGKVGYAAAIREQANDPVLNTVEWAQFIVSELAKIEDEPIDF